jgi:hypothetical protein
MNRALIVRLTPRWLVLSAACWLGSLVGAHGGVKATLTAGFFGHPQGGITVNGRVLSPSIITDLIVLPDGRVIACGVTNTWNTLPSAGKRRMLFDEAVGTNMAFVAAFSRNLEEAEWLTVFPYDCLVPQRIARGPDGSLVVGGRRMDRLLELIPEAQHPRWRDNRAVLMKLSADGSEVLWAHPGVSHQVGVSGLLVEPDGAILWTGGTMDRGQPARVVRLDAEGKKLLSWPGRPDADIQWALNLHRDAPDLNQPGQFWHFYNRAEEKAHDYDGRGAVNAVTVRPAGLRQGGPLLRLPDGDLIVGATLQYTFADREGHGHGALDVFLARYSAEGRLKWSTNLYRRGDGLHATDQRLVDLAFDPGSGAVFVLAHQHGEARYRLAGPVEGDIGNNVVSWVGKVDAVTGGLMAGWYFQNPRPDSAPGWPRLSTNALERMAVDDAGQVYLVGTGGASVHTGSGALQHWPHSQVGGQHGVLVILENDLDKVAYATLVRGSEESALRRWPKVDLAALALSHDGVILGGTTTTDALPLAYVLPWSAPENERTQGALLGRLEFRASDDIAAGFQPE